MMDIIKTIELVEQKTKEETERLRYTRERYDVEVSIVAIYSDYIDLEKLLKEHIRTSDILIKVEDNIYFVYYMYVDLYGAKKAIRHISSDIHNASNNKIYSILTEFDQYSNNDTLIQNIIIQLKKQIEDKNEEVTII